MKMNFIEIANAIGIENADSISKNVSNYYPISEIRKSELCSLDLIERLQDKFNFFGEYFDIIKKSWIETESDKLRKSYIDVNSLYMKDNSFNELHNIKTVEPDSPLNDFLNLFIFLPSVEKMYEMYIDRGFSDSEALEYMDNFKKMIASVHNGSLGRPAMTISYFNWLCHYIKAIIFKAGGFNFELHPFVNNIVIRNKNDGKLVVLCGNKWIHKSGFILGSCGKKEKDNCYYIEYEETNDSFIGYPAINGLCSKNKAVYSKNDWELVMQSDDICVGIHIPQNSDISRDAFFYALKQAKNILKERYADYNPKMFNCISWLLSIELEEMLNKDSKILNFGRFFERYPFGDTTCVNAFSFIFKNCSSNELEQLPEDTSLRKSYKNRLLNGEYIHMFGGVIELDL